jgi:hypothetical protein
MEFDFATLGTYFPASTNVTGADRVGSNWALVLDVPVDLGPPAGPTRTPGNVVTTDGVTWNHFFDDLQAEGAGGWPLSSVVDALSCRSNPGKIDSPTSQIFFGKSGGNVDVVCPGSCSSGAELYGLYEGTIASIHAGVYDHVKKDCTLACPTPYSFLITGTSNYYLVVPYHGSCTGAEGSYGLNSVPAERPRPGLLADRCVDQQVLTACP